MCTLRCFPFVSVWHIYAACNQMVSEFWRFDRERARIYVHLLENEIAICAERSNLRVYTRIQCPICSTHMTRAGNVCIYLSVCGSATIYWCRRSKFIFFVLKFPASTFHLAFEYACSCTSVRVCEFFFCIFHFNFSRSFR